MLRINNLSFSYRKAGADLFKDFCMEFGEGQVCGLLGKNGAGKSTLIYLMTGLLTPTSGEVIFNGENVRRRLPKTMNDLFLVPEEFELPDLSLDKFVSINAPFYPKFSLDDMNRYLELFEMEKNVKLKSLSMGQKKKVFMSFALATNTSLLLMDEPTNGLDIPGKSQFRKFIAQGMSDDKTIIISTHQVRDIDSLLDHVAIIDNSRVLLNASLSEVSRHLTFRPLQPGEQPIYAMQNVMGTIGVIPNNGNEETNVDIEMLFNATLQNPEKMQELFTVKTSEQ